MQPEPRNVLDKVSTQRIASATNSSPQHGQHRDDNLQASLLLVPDELQGASEPQPSGDRQVATRADAMKHDGAEVAATELNRPQSSTPQARNRIAEYENALVTPPRKNSGGPLFEVIKTNRAPDDKSSPVAKLPNGE